MSLSEQARLTDIVAACDAIASHVASDGHDEQIVIDAIRMRLIEIGEAVKELSVPLREREPIIPWADVARMRDLVAHRYFDTTHSIVMTTARSDVPELRLAALRLLG